MRLSHLVSLAVVSALSTAPAVAQQGSPNTTPTTVTRIVLIRIKTGRASEFWKDVRQNLKPIYDEEKRRGVIVEWSMATKVTTDNENDYGVVLRLTYKNFGALDSLTPLTDPITLAHYGTVEKRTTANNARGDNGTVVQSFLLRDATVNEWK